MVKLQPLQKCQVRVLLNALGVELSEECGARSFKLS